MIALCLAMLALLVPSVTAAQEKPVLERFAVELAPPTGLVGDSSIRSLSLSQALDRALAENTTLALVRAEEQLARGTHLTAKATLYPALAVGLGARRLDGQVQGSFGELRDVSFSTYTGGVALVYGANIGARLKQAFAERQNLDAASLDTLETEQRLLFRVVELYQNLLLATVAVHISEEVVAGSEQFLTIVAAKTAGGLGLGADVARAEAKLATDRQHLLQARNLLVGTSTRLAVVLRLDVKTLLVPADAQLAPAHYLEISGGSSAANAPAPPDVRAAQKRAAATQQFLSAAKWDIYAPELRAEIEELTIGDTTSDLDGRSERRALLLWTFSPVAMRQLGQRRTEEHLARLRLTEAEDRAAGEIRRADAGLMTAKERIPLAGDGLRAARVTLRLSEARFRAGTAILLEVLDAQDVLAESRFNLAHAIVQYNTAQARLLAATGTIRRNSFVPIPTTAP